jgi:hypothetical protein
MKTLWSSLVVVVCWVGLVHAFTCKEGLNPVQEFNCQTLGAFDLCALFANTTHLEATVALAKDANATQININIPCVNDYKPQVQAAYDKTKHYLANNPQSTEHLKNYYTYWLSAMDGLYMFDYLRPRAFKIRQDAKREIIRQFAARLVLETP